MSDPITERLAATEAHVLALTTHEEMAAQNGGWTQRACLLTNAGRAQLIALLREAREALREQGASE